MLSNREMSFFGFRFRLESGSEYGFNSKIRIRLRIQKNEAGLRLHSAPDTCPSLIRSTGMPYYRFYESVNTKRVKKKENNPKQSCFYLKANVGNIKLKINFLDEKFFQIESF